MFTREELIQRGMNFIVLVLSLSVHEWAHAWSAARLGDDTAEREGRLTLNPMAHIDPIGTVLLPLLGVPFGWAKPVPVNPLRFRRSVNMRTGIAVTAAAGPISNLVLAVLCTVLLGLWWRFRPPFALALDAATTLFLFTIVVNVGLAVFNLLPVPPLDGSRIAFRLLAGRFPRFWAAVERYAPFLFVAVVLGGRYVLAAPIAFLHGVIFSIVQRIAGL
jgi:Zn-dependent protease